MTSTLKNPFVFHEESEVIACVGSNGGTFDDDIFEGFTISVTLLLDHAKKTHNEDIIVYPLVYSARHAIELGLKMLIDSVLRIVELRGAKIEAPVDLADVKKRLHTHDINRLTSIISEICYVDNRIADIFASHSANIELFFLDPEGDMFKYRYSKEGVEHLEDGGIGQICLDLFVGQFLELQKQLASANIELRQLVDEYQLGTFTKILSRKQLFEIASELPPLSEWTDTSFDSIKRSLQTKYRVSSNELSKAINIIKKHREMSVKIGCENKFRDLSPRAIADYKKLFLSRQAEEEGAPAFTAQRAADDIDKLLRQDASSLSRYALFEQSTLVAEDISILLAFSEIGHIHMSYYSEHLDSRYDYFINGHHQREWALTKLTGQYAFERICCGMEKCGQITYLNLMRA